MGALLEPPVATERLPPRPHPADLHPGPALQPPQPARVARARSAGARLRSSESPESPPGRAATQVFLGWSNWGSGRGARAGLATQDPPRPPPPPQFPEPPPPCRGPHADSPILRQPSPEDTLSLQVSRRRPWGLFSWPLPTQRGLETASWEPQGECGWTSPSHSLAAPAPPGSGGLGCCSRQPLQIHGSGPIHLSVPTCPAFSCPTVCLSGNKWVPVSLSGPSVCVWGGGVSWPGKDRRCQLGGGGALGLISRAGAFISTCSASGGETEPAGAGECWALGYLGALSSPFRPETVPP